MKRAETFMILQSKLGIFSLSSKASSSNALHWPINMHISVRILKLYFLDGI